MSNEFRLYADTNGLPEAASEMAFTMNVHTQETSFQSETELYTICGFLSEEITYSSQAQYDNITTPMAPNQLLWNMFKDETQRSLATYGYLTKKTYSNSSTQSITLKFRAVSNSSLYNCFVGTKKGTTNDPVVIAKSLMSASMNTVGKTALFNFTSPGNTEVGRAVTGALEHTVVPALLVAANVIGTPFGVNFDSPSMELSKVAHAAKVSANTAGNAISHPIDTLMVKNPPVIRLLIGNIFDKDYMVIKTVDVTFSKEFHTKGVPLYADYTVTLESLFNSSNQDDPTKENIFGTGLVASKSYNVVVK